MAKITKKSSKAKTPTATTSEEPRKVMPDVPPGLVSVAMLPNDLVILTNLMSICAKIFEEQALIAAQANDEQKYAILAARHKISSAFADKFAETCKMGEPESREMH